MNLTRIQLRTGPLVAAIAAALLVGLAARAADPKPAVDRDSLVVRLEKSGPLAPTQFTSAIYDPMHPVAGSFPKDGTWSDDFNVELKALLSDLNTTTGSEACDALFRKIGKLLHADAAALLVTALFFAVKEDLNWGFNRSRNSSTLVG